MKKIGTKTEIHSHVIPVFHEWTTRDIWKMLQPTLYKDPDGNYQTGGFDRVPDGEPTHWDIVLVRGEKSYEKVSEEDCNCDLSSGEMCVHWREIR